jgi:pilus assembly protein CpaE
MSEANSPGHEGHIAAIPRISIQAFCEAPEMCRVIDDASQDRRMCKAQVKVQMGGLVAALEAYRSAPTPNLIVLETSAKRSLLLEQLEDLAQYCDAGTRVVVVGRENDISLYRELTSRGVSDYFVAPLSVMEFIGRISLLYNGPKAGAIGRTVAVFGAKGGVGASTLAHNLAWSISRQFEMQTVICDLDLPFGTAALNYNQDPPQGLADAVFSPDRLDMNFIDRLLARCGDQLSILSAPATLDRAYDLDEQAIDPILEILGSTAPCSILDVPHCWNGWTRRVLTAVDEVIVVAAPDLANLRNAKTLVDMLRSTRTNDRAPHLVLNMVGMPRRPEISVAEFSRVIELEPTGVVPFDPKIFGVAANNGQMLDEVDVGSGVVEILDAMARVIAGRASGQKAPRGLLPKLLNRFVGKKAG